MSGYDEMVRQLRLAVYGNEHDSPEAADEDWETLLWKVGEFRRRTEDAHSYLDTLGAPRKPEGDERHPYTLRARIEELIGRERY